MSNRVLSAIAVCVCAKWHISVYIVCVCFSQHISYMAHFLHSFYCVHMFRCRRKAPLRVGRTHCSERGISIINPQEVLMLTRCNSLIQTGSANGGGVGLSCYLKSHAVDYIWSLCVCVLFFGRAKWTALPCVRGLRLFHYTCTYFPAHDSRRGGCGASIYDLYALIRLRFGLTFFPHAYNINLSWRIRINNIAFMYKVCME